MKAATRTKHLMTLLGWQGGTIHDACAAISVPVDAFLYQSAHIYETGPSCDFARGYRHAACMIELAVPVKLEVSRNAGNVQYWLGAVSALH